MGTITSTEKANYDIAVVNSKKIAVLEGDTPDFSVIPTDGSVKKVIWLHPTRWGSFYFGSGTDDNGIVFSNWVREFDEWVESRWFSDITPNDTSFDNQPRLEYLTKNYPKVRLEKNKVYTVNSDVELSECELDLNGSTLQNDTTTDVVTYGEISGYVRNGVLKTTVSGGTGSPLKTANITRSNEVELVKMEDIDVQAPTTNGNAILVNANGANIKKVIVKNTTVNGAGQAGLGVLAQTKDGDGNILYDIDYLEIDNYISDNTGTYAYGMPITISGHIKETKINRVTATDYDDIGLELASVGTAIVDNVTLSAPRTNSNYFIMVSAWGGTHWRVDNVKFNNIKLIGDGKVSTYGDGSIVFDGLFVDAERDTNGVATSPAPQFTLSERTKLINANMKACGLLYNGSATNSGDYEQTRPTPIIENSEITFGNLVLNANAYFRPGVGAKFTLINSTIRAFLGDYTSTESGQVDTIATDTIVYDKANKQRYKALVDTNTLDSDGLPSPAFTDTSAWDVYNPDKVCMVRDNDTEVLMINSTLEGRVYQYEDGVLRIFSDSRIVGDTLSINGTSKCYVDNSQIGSSTLSTSVTIATDASIEYNRSFLNGSKVANTSW